MQKLEEQKKITVNVFSGANYFLCFFHILLFQSVCRKNTALNNHKQIAE